MLTYPLGDVCLMTTIFPFLYDTADCCKNCFRLVLAQHCEWSGVEDLTFMDEKTSTFLDSSLHKKGNDL